MSAETAAPPHVPAGAERAGAGRRGDLLLAAAVAVDLGVQVVNSSTAGPARAAGVVAATVACQVACAGLQLPHSLRRWRSVRDRTWRVSLALQVVLTVAAVGVAGQYWGSAPAFALASCLLLLPARVGWGLVATLELATLAVTVARQLPLLDVVYFQTANVTAALAFWGLTRLNDDIAALRASRETAARLAVAEERERFSRDLHDLLGYSLSAITLTGELAARLTSTDPARAGRELDRVRVLAREAVADVGSVAHGDAGLSLAEQLAAARTVLDAGDVQVSVTGAPGALPPVVDTVLATVVREAVTNLLRHSRARNCRIDMSTGADAVRVVVANDAAGEPTGAPQPQRGGLGNLRSRLTALGGRLHVEHRDDWFVVTASVPLGGA